MNYGVESEAYLMENPGAVKQLSEGVTRCPFAEAWNNLKWQMSKVEELLPAFSNPSSEADRIAATHHVMAAMDKFNEAIRAISKTAAWIKMESKRRMRIKTAPISSQFDPEIKKYFDSLSCEGSRLFVGRIMNGQPVTSTEARLIGCSNPKYIVRKLETLGLNISESRLPKSNTTYYQLIKQGEIR